MLVSAVIGKATGGIRNDAMGNGVILIIARYGSYYVFGQQYSLMQNQQKFFLFKKKNGLLEYDSNLRSSGRSVFTVCFSITYEL